MLIQEKTKGSSTWGEELGPSAADDVFSHWPGGSPDNAWWRAHDAQSAAGELGAADRLSSFGENMPDI